MSEHTKPILKFTYNQSTFEQYEPSNTSMNVHYLQGESDNVQPISDYHKVKFLKMCQELIMDEIIRLKMGKQ